jgi:hypothetical protein
VAVGNSSIIIFAILGSANQRVAASRISPLASLRASCAIVGALRWRILRAGA